MQEVVFVVLMAVNANQVALFIQFIKFVVLHISMDVYRPRSEGDNVLGSVRPSVRPSVCLSVCLSDLSCLNRLTFDLDILHRGRP